MKRMLFAGAFALATGVQALAADLPPVAPPPPRAAAIYVPTPVAIYNWSGIYLGINGGWAFGTSNWSQAGATTGDFNTSGGLVGGTIGANFQMGSFVFGVEGDGDWTNLNGTSTSAVFGCGTGCKTKSQWLGTARGRLGYAFDRILLFGTGGAAFGDVEAGLVGPGTFFNSTQVGWTAGAGIEAAFAPGWSVKAEYLYIDLQNASCTTAACGGAAVPVTVKFKANVARAGLNYRFNLW